MFSKGPKYREPVNISWQKAKTQTFIGLSEYIGQLSSNKGIRIGNFREWKNKLISAIDHEIKNLK